MMEAAVEKRTRSDGDREAVALRLCVVCELHVCVLCVFAYVSRGRFVDLIGCVVSNYVFVAQWIRHPPTKRGIVGSSPIEGIFSLPTNGAETSFIVLIVFSCLLFQTHVASTRFFSICVLSPVLERTLRTHRKLP